MLPALLVCPLSTIGRSSLRFVTCRGLTFEEAKHEQRADTSDRIGISNRSSDREESIRSDSHLQRVDDKTSGDCCERAADICSRLARIDLGCDQGDPCNIRRCAWPRSNCVPISRCGGNSLFTKAKRRLQWHRSRPSARPT